jgi:hypothetical protein
MVLIGIIGGSARLSVTMTASDFLTDRCTLLAGTFGIAALTQEGNSTLIPSCEPNDPMQGVFE